MNQRVKIALGLLALVVIVVVVLKFTANMKNDIITKPIIIPLKIEQKIRPASQGTTEGYTAADLHSISKQISFDVSWKNSFGFDSVTAIKLQHKVGTDIIQEIPFDSGDYITSGGTNSHTFDGDDLPSQENVRGDNTFSILYKTSSTDWRPIETAGNSTFPTITIDDNDLQLTLDILKPVTYTFIPVLDTLSNDDIQVNYEDTEFWVYSAPKTGVTKYTIGYTLDKSYGAKPIIITPSSSGVSYDIPAVNLYIKVDNTNTRPIKISGDSTLGLDTGDATITRDHDFHIVKEGTTFYIKKPVSASTDNNNIFLTYITTGGLSKYKMQDLTTISSAEVFDTIKMRVSDQPYGDIDCEQDVITETQQTGTSSPINCNGNNTSYGQKCVKYKTRVRPSGSGATCTRTPEGVGDSFGYAIEEGAPLNCLWTEGTTGYSSCGTSCHIDGVTAGTYQKTYTKTRNEYRSTCGIPTPSTESCPNVGKTCPPCATRTQFKRCANSTEVAGTGVNNRSGQAVFNIVVNDSKHPRQCTYTSGRTQWGDGSANQCPVKRACTRSAPVSEGCVTSSNGRRERFKVNPVNPDNRPSSDPNCGASSSYDAITYKCFDYNTGNCDYKGYIYKLGKDAELGTLYGEAHAYGC